MNSKARKWTRVTPLEELTNESSSKSFSPPVSCYSSLGNGGVVEKTERGRKPNILYGSQPGLESVRQRDPRSRFSANGSFGSTKSDGARATVQEQDFEYWKVNTIDALTGKMEDCKIAYNSAGEDRGVCRYALLGQSCPLGADCPFSHPVRRTVEVRRELFLNMTLLTLRYSLTPDTCAVVEIMDVITPVSFSVWVHQLCDNSLTVLRSYALDGKKRPYPEGFSKLLDQMAVFYQKHGQQASFAFRSLDDVADTFIAVHVPLHGKYWWLRGIIMDFQKAIGVLKVRLPDLGRTFEVKDVLFIRRLDQSFLQEPWFATRIELGRIVLSVNSVSTPATLTWLKGILVGKLAFIRVLEEYDDPLVELMCTIDNSTVRSLGDYLVDEMIAFTQDVPSQDTGSDSDRDEDDDPVEIIPG